MDNSAILKAFNNHFIEFIDDIIRVFPDDDDIVAAKNGLVSIKKANPKLIHNIWSTYISTKYGTEIDAGDIDFFTNKDYSEELNGMTYANTIMSKIDVLREPIRRMDPENKSKVISYMQNLTKLADMYVSGSASRQHISI